MASKIITTTTLDITLLDSDNYEMTLKIDNPREDISSKADVKTALDTVISQGWWLGRSGMPITSVGRVTKVATTKYIFDEEE